MVNQHATDGGKAAARAAPTHLQRGHGGSPLLPRRSTNSNDLGHDGFLRIEHQRTRLALDRG
jgi:hypothetical protein